LLELLDGLKMKRFDIEDTKIQLAHVANPEVVIEALNMLIDTFNANIEEAKK